MNFRSTWVCLFGVVASGCAHFSSSAATEALVLEEVAASDKQLTGVAVSASSGRVFINFPRWVDVPSPSVAEVWPDGRLVPFPDAKWNEWDGQPDSAAEHFVCVQAVFVDAKDQLWILDPASPAFGGVVPGGAKLLQVDLPSGKVVRVYPFDAVAAPTKSYLNDVRVDLPRGRAYLTDSGLGGIVVLDLATGAATRRLETSPAVQAESISVMVSGQPWVGDGGKSPMIPSDGIALDAEGKFLYFHSLTGRTLYRVPAVSLSDLAVTEPALGALVENVATTSAADGLLEDSRGNIFLTDLEHDAVRVRRPDGKLSTVVEDPKLSWPDSLAIDSGGRLYVTASQIHRMPAFNKGVDKRERPFRVFRTKTAAIPAP